jgi:hypothetical protein
VAACNTVLPKTSHNTNTYCKTLSSQAEAGVSYTELIYITVKQETPFGSYDPMY